MHSDRYFTHCSPQLATLSITNLRDRINYVYRNCTTRNVKLYILRGKYKNQPGIIVTSYIERKYYMHTFRKSHRVLLGDGTTIIIAQQDAQLLDPFFHLPFGIPVLTATLLFNYG